MRWAGILTIAAMVLGGCPRKPDVEHTTPVVLDATGVSASADTADLAVVLKSAVTGDGRVDPKAMAAKVDRLDAQLKRMAVAGPTATPSLYTDYGSRWAYWYNARAAWSMKLAQLAGCPQQLHSDCLADRKFPLDGRQMSLSEIDALLVAEARRTGDFRLAACAPGVRVEYGPMPQRPITADALEEQLERMFSTLVADARRFVIDAADRRVLVGPMLWAVRDDVIARYGREYGGSEVQFVTALRPYVDLAARKRLQIAIGYEAVEAPSSGELAIPKRKVFFPGKIGRTEPQ